MTDDEFIGFAAYYELKAEKEQREIDKAKAR